jgi:hypothetical protein
VHRKTTKNSSAARSDAATGGQSSSAARSAAATGGQSSSAARSAAATGGQSSSAARSRSATRPRNELREQRCRECRECAYNYATHYYTQVLRTHIWTHTCKVKPPRQEIELGKIRGTVCYAFDIRRSVPRLWMRSRVHQTPYVRKILSRVRWLPNCEEAINIICSFAYHDFSSRALSAHLYLRSGIIRDHLYVRSGNIRIAQPSFQLPKLQLVAVEDVLLQERAQWTCSRCRYINRHEYERLTPHLACAVCLAPRGDARYIRGYAYWNGSCHVLYPKRNACQIWANRG